MKKHMYLRILWPYILEIIMLGFLDYRVSGSLSIWISPFMVASCVMFLPFVLSLFFFIKNYNKCSKSQKIIFVLIDVLALLLLIFCIGVYYTFLTHPFPIL